MSSHILSAGGDALSFKAASPLCSFRVFQILSVGGDALSFKAASLLCSFGVFFCKSFIQKVLYVHGILLMPLGMLLSAPKTLGANFEHFWLVVWPQVTNECYNIDVKMLINAGTLVPRVTNWLPEFDGILFFSLGANTRPYKAQHLLVT